MALRLDENIGIEFINIRRTRAATHRTMQSFINTTCPFDDESIQEIQPIDISRSEFDLDNHTRST